MYFMITLSVTFPKPRYEETPRPKVPVPAVLLQMAVLLHQLAGTLPLKPLHQVARRHVQRAGDEQVDGVGGRLRLATTSCGTS
jgi:hypothetical protein